MKKQYFGNFNSHAHVERDGVSAEISAWKNISTHTLTWSVTGKTDEIADILVNFNSHAHVERDLINPFN